MSCLVSLADLFYKQKNLLLLLTFCTVMASCEKNSNIKGGFDHQELDERLLPLLFDKGSYWVYEEEETATVDTIFLTEIEMDTLGPYAIGNGYSESQQLFYLTYHSSVSGFYEEQYVGYIISRGTVSGGYVYLASHQIGDVAMNASIADIHDSLFVNEQLYYHVVQMDISDDSYLKQNMMLYYVDSVGLVKKEIIKNFLVESTFSLSSSKVLFYKSD